MNHLPRKTENLTNVEMEERLLGCIFVQPDNITRLAGKIQGNQFADSDLGKLFDHLSLLNETGKPIADIALIVGEIKAIGLDSEISTARLAKMFQNVGDSQNAPYYAENIVSCFHRRELMEVGSFLMANANDASLDPESIRGEAEEKLANVKKQSSKSSCFQDVAKRVISNIKEGNVSHNRCESGIYNLDMLTGGFLSPEMIVIAARPGMGKTTLAMQMARFNAERSRRGLFCTIEMSEEELTQRILCSHSGIDQAKLRSGKLEQDDFSRFAEAEKDLADIRLTFFDQPKMTMKDIRNRAKLENAREPLSFIVIDYISLITPRNIRDSRNEQVSEISRAIKQLAKEIKVPIFALSQLNRASDKNNSRPILSNLRDSGAVEQDADMVIFIHQSKGKHELIVAKQRHGETGIIAVSFDKKRGHFSEDDSWHG